MNMGVGDVSGRVRMCEWVSMNIIVTYNAHVHVPSSSNT